MQHVELVFYYKKTILSLTRIKRQSYTVNNILKHLIPSILKSAMNQKCIFMKKIKYPFILDLEPSDNVFYIVNDIVLITKLRDFFYK